LGGGFCADCGFTTCCCCCLCHCVCPLSVVHCPLQRSDSVTTDNGPLTTDYLPSSFTPFLPATVLRGPLRVRALERVRWPRTGRLRRCRAPRYVPMSRSRAIFC